MSQICDSDANLFQVQVSHHGRSIPCYQEKQGPTLYRVQFTPDGAGHYKIHVYFNNMEVKGIGAELSGHNTQESFSKSIHNRYNRCAACIARCQRYYA